MEDLIIWGAGNKSIHKLEWAAFANYRVLFFVDSDADKWGGTVDNIPIYSPDVLKKYKCLILIPDAYIDEIEEQLHLIAYQGRRIGYTQFKKDIVCRKEVNIDCPKVYIKDEISFVFDAYFSGMNWGGAESWSCMISNQLADLGVRTQIICGQNEKFDRFAYHCQHFYDENEVYLVKEIAQKIVECLPCVFLSHASIALYAARIVKNVFPDQIQLILVAHNDKNGIYEKFKIWSDRIDKIICISNRIQSEFKERYDIKENILIYKPNPIKIPIISDKREVHKRVLKIGFAARLEKKQKRVHLLPEIIKNCVQKNIGVEFNIAGEGECLEMLKSFVSENHLENQVHVFGWIPPTMMDKFWREQDICLNISSVEGMCLTMLEAMACGAVPIVTDVSGVSDVIEDGENGFIVSTDNWLEIADKIEILNKDRELLQQAGNYNIEFMKDKFNVVDYAKWMMDFFGNAFP